MKDQILAHIDEPAFLEKIYRNNRIHFKKEFFNLYPQLQGHSLAEFWKERLHFEKEEFSAGSRRDLIFIVVLALIAGLIAKMPALLQIEEEYFYSRNIGFILFPALTAWFAWKNKLSLTNLLITGGAFLAGVLFINFLPNDKGSDTLILSCIHLVLFLWSVLGFAFVNGQRTNAEKQMQYLSFNGDLLVMTALIVIAGGILTGITIGLFSLIGYDIANFYFENIVVFALPAAPILGTWLIQTNPSLVGKVSPVIARIFSPLVLIMLVIYLGAMIYAGKDPYNDRDFLLVFNALLIGVMAIIFFSVAEGSKSEKSKAELWILLLLSTVTIVVNGIALSAIIFRISEWGITPNRMAVLGGNLLILLNLLLVSWQLYKLVSNKTEINAVGKAISYFLPVYAIWTIVVTFLFPFLFGFA